MAAASGNVRIVQQGFSGLQRASKRAEMRRDAPRLRDHGHVMAVEMGRSPSYRRTLIAWSSKEHRKNRTDRGNQRGSDRLLRRVVRAGKLGSPFTVSDVVSETRAPCPLMCASPNAAEFQSTAQRACSHEMLELTLSSMRTSIPPRSGTSHACCCHVLHRGGAASVSTVPAAQCLALGDRSRPGD